MCSLQGSIYHSGACLRILQCSLSFHHPDFIFAVVQHQQGITFAYLLMFRKINLINIARCTQIDRRHILLYLRIITGFRLLIAQKEKNNFNYSPNNHSNSKQTYYNLPAA